MPAMDRIVVGVDGSPQAERALRWAAEEADRHGAALAAVMAWDFLAQPHSAGAGDEDGFDPTYGADDAAATLRAVVQDVLPGRQVEESAVLAGPAEALVDAATAADLVVVGDRGVGGFAGLLLGSVSERVLEEAPCPVAVVRGDADRPAHGPVVVGVDGSEVGAKALRWAAEEARARKAPLRAVHAWQVPYLLPPIGGGVMEELEAGARSVLDDALRDAALGDLQVDAQLSSAGAAEAIIGHSSDASLIVVGSRGLGRFRRAVLGSTSRQLAHHAPCPLVVVPADAD
jgi:nucleotide-binding universal stress UspA family protein